MYVLNGTLTKENHLNLDKKKKINTMTNRICTNDNSNQWPLQDTYKCVRNKTLFIVLSLLTDDIMCMFECTTFMNNLFVLEKNMKTSWKLLVAK